MKKILIMGLPGSGKTTLASELVPLLKAKWIAPQYIEYIFKVSLFFKSSTAS